MDALIKIKLEPMEMENNRKKKRKKKRKENKLKKFKLENRRVQLTTMEVRLAMGGIDTHRGSHWWLVMSCSVVCLLEKRVGYGLGCGEETKRA